MVWLSPVRRLRNIKRRIIRPKADFFWLSLDFIPPERPVKVPLLRRQIEPPPPLSIAELQQTLDRLGKDESNKGVILEIQTGAPFATAQSVIDHLKVFQNQNKEVITFATSYSLLTYWLASIGSQVTVQNQGVLWIKGLYSSLPFMADFLKKCGLQFEKIAVSPYKSSLDELARSDIAPEAKENRKALFKSLFDTFVQDIASNRNLPEEQVLDAIDQAPLSAEQAVERKLIDRQVSPEGLPRLLGTPNKPARVRSYAVASRATLIPPKPSMKKTIAVIPVCGVIVDGKSRELPPRILSPFETKQAGDHTIVPLIRRALASPRVAAAVLHVNSRGGSVTASESIRLALQAFASHKPLVAYLSNVATSGGYYIATPASYIVAQPQTITGSIGVLNGKFNFQGFLENQQIKATEFKMGKRADWLQPTKPFGDEERRILTEQLAYFYDHFLKIVADSRDLEKDYLRESLAGGRIWTGRQASEHKLVNQLGNLQTAIFKVRELAGLKLNSGVITIQPAKKSIVPLGFRGIELSEYSLFFQNLARTQLWMIEPDIPFLNSY